MRGALSIAAIAMAGCTAPSFGEMPARCADGACPEGYDCIHGVCALPGTPVPITVTTVPFSMRGSDMRLVPQANTVLVVWETYPYSSEGQRVVGARVGVDGKVSPRMDLVTGFNADPGSVEPYFDVLAMPEDRLIVALSAPPLPSETEGPRLATYRVELPPEGQEALEAVDFQSALGEVHMQTAGYGAVSSPKLVTRPGGVALGYVQTLIDTDVVPGPQTKAELQRFLLIENGELEPVDSNPRGFAARAGLPVAVGVVDAFRYDSGTWWFFDEERPSAVRVQDVSGDREAKLESLAVPVAADATSITYIKPSKRAGDKQPTDPVSGAAELRRVDVPLSSDSPTTDTQLGPMPPIRDTPRPAWINRPGAKAILVTPGQDIDAPELGVYLVDPATGATSLATSIPRMSSQALAAVRAQLVGSQLFVAWVETDQTSSTIRLAIVPEPK